MLIKWGTNVAVSYILVFVGLFFPAWGQTNKQQSHKSVSGKCDFLRAESIRLGKEEQDSISKSPFVDVRTVDDLAAANDTISNWASFFSDREAVAARRNLLRLEIGACEKGKQLSDPSRIDDIDAARSAQIQRALSRWQSMAGEPGKEFEEQLTARINSIYEADAKTFYAPSRSSYNDPDIGKDYPDLSGLIQNSAMDSDTKAFYKNFARYLRYEEAGELANILRGTEHSKGLSYAYRVRSEVEHRVTDESERQQEAARIRSKENTRKMNEYFLLASTVVASLAAILILISPARAKRRAFQKNLRRSSFWFGQAEWILWEPGETVVLLEHKKLLPPSDPSGGYRAISTWKGQEYKGRVSLRTQCLTWRSDPILTSDGLAVHLEVGVWWKIENVEDFVSRIAWDYQEDETRRGDNLGDAAEFWIKKLAAGTLREEINQLPAEQLISPYVHAYLQAPGQVDAEVPLPKRGGMPDFSNQLRTAQAELDLKTNEYGIHIERLQVHELKLPPRYQEKLAAVREAFLEPSRSRALTEAQVIALKGLSDVIGKEKTGLIELLKHSGISDAGLNLFGGALPIVQPIVTAVHRQAERAVGGSVVDADALPSGQSGTENGGKAE